VILKGAKVLKYYQFNKIGFKYKYSFDGRGKFEMARNPNKTNECVQLSC